MNWALLTIMAWITFGLELGLRDLLQIGPTAIAPSFVLPLAIYVALWASPSAALWAALAIGLLVDLTAPITLVDGSTAIVAGPHALGYLLATQLVLTIRASILRRNPLAMVILTMLSGGIIQVVVVVLHAIRSGYDPVAIAPLSAMLVGLGSAVYSGASALIFALILLPLTPIMGFPAHSSGQSRHITVRRN